MSPTISSESECSACVVFMHTWGNCDVIDTNMSTKHVGTKSYFSVYIYWITCIVTFIANVLLLITTSVFFRFYYIICGKGMFPQNWVFILWYRQSKTNVKIHRYTHSSRYPILQFTLTVT